MRIISTDSICYSSTAKSYSDFSNYSLAYVCDSDSKQILTTVPRIQGDMAIRKKDLFIATAWWTAYHLEKIEKFQRECWGEDFRHVYFVQDYEPHFYGWSSKSQLAENTYNNSWLKIYNTQLLHSYFVNREKEHGLSYVLKPDINESINAELKKRDGTKKEKIVLLYGRPNAERNCNEILLESIAILNSSYSIKEKWKIISLGECYQHPLIDSLGIEVLGKLSLSEYAELLSKAYLGISLMVSPHPSYPPVEMSFAGIHTYTNYYDNKVKGTIDNPYLHFGSVNSDEIAFFMYSMMEEYSENKRYLYQNDKDIFGGGDSMVTVVNKLYEQITVDLDV